jgi:hypothetical protein
VSWGHLSLCWGLGYDHVRLCALYQVTRETGVSVAVDTPEVSVVSWGGGLVCSAWSGFFPTKRAHAPTQPCVTRMALVIVVSPHTHTLTESTHARAWVSLHPLPVHLLGTQLIPLSSLCSPRVRYPILCSGHTSFGKRCYPCSRTHAVRTQAPHPTLPCTLTHVFTPKHPGSP